MKIPWRQGRESATIAENIEHSLYQEMFRHVLKLNVFMKTNARIPRKWQYFPNRSGVGKMSFTYISRIFASNNYWYSLEQLCLCSWISQQQFCVMKLLKIVFDESTAWSTLKSVLFKNHYFDLPLCLTPCLKPCPCHRAWLLSSPSRQSLSRDSCLIIKKGHWSFRIVLIVIQ